MTEEPVYATFKGINKLIHHPRPKEYYRQVAKMMNSPHRYPEFSLYLIELMDAEIAFTLPVKNLFILGNN